MPKVSEILKLMEDWAPPSLKLDYDNVGLLVGEGSAEVRCVLVALDITPEVVREAENIGAELIVSHHPVIFHPLYKLCPDGHAAGTVVALIRANIAAVCMHTNLDITDGGVNDILAERLGLTEVVKIPDGGYNVLRMGRLPVPMEPMDFVADVSRRLGSPVKYVRGDRPIKIVAVCGGAGGDDESYDYATAAGCDAYVSSEFRHYNLIRAKSAGITLVDGGHFATEFPVCEAIVRRIGAAFPALEVRLSVQTGAEEYFNA